jgi:(Z)-2-((N-methylformamido)methylene)-5-hydroxybutyrolactone dehydrogenase
MTERYELFIGGEWEPAAGGRTFPSLNPYSGEVWAELADAGAEDVERAVAAARTAFDGGWGRSLGTERAALLRRLAAILERDAEDLARIETTDNGKLFREMVGQTRYIPRWYEYFAGAADKIHGETIPSDRPNFLLYTRREPLGVVAAITPWNSPLLLMTWKVAPALATGCTVVVKPSEYASASTLEFARRVSEAGFPPGVFNVVTGMGPATGASLVEAPGVDKIAFTGSTATGAAIARSAAERLVPVALELGGKSPNIVFRDADLVAAANGVVAGIYAASGQTCIAGSRLLVERSVHDELVERLAARAKTIALGDPFDPATEMGPMATEPQRDKVLHYIESATRQGAEVRCGGGTPADRGGLFIEPTILTGVKNDMEVARDEIFGPVLAVIPFDDEEEAVQLANDSPFGLAAGVWTQNGARAHRVAHRLRAGTVWINAYRVVAYNAPFGGFGASGWGRENGLAALDEYCATKSVWVELSGETRDPFVLG